VLPAAESAALVAAAVSHVAEVAVDLVAAAAEGSAVALAADPAADSVAAAVDWAEEADLAVIAAAAEQERLAVADSAAGVNLAGAVDWEVRAEPRVAAWGLAVPVAVRLAAAEPADSAQGALVSLARVHSAAVRPGPRIGSTIRVAAT